MPSDKAGSEQQADPSRERRADNLARRELLRVDVAAGLRSIAEGRISHAIAQDIKAEAVRRRAFRPAISESAQ